MAEKIYNIGSVKSVRGDPEFVKGFVDGSLKEIKAEAYEGATKIGDYAFYSASKITKFGMPNSVESIGTNAITSLPITELSLSNKLKSIGAGSIKSLSKLESLTINSDLEKVGDGSLKSLKESIYNVYGSGKYLGKGDNPYYLLVDTTINSSNTEIIIHKDCEIIADKIFGNYPVYSYIKKFSFEDGSKLKQTPAQMATSATKLTYAEIPENVEIIRANAFSNYSAMNLSELVIKTDKLKTIEAYAFKGCSKLTTIKTASLKNLFEVDYKTDDACLNYYGIANFYDLDGNLLDTSVLPDGLEKIGQNALSVYNFGGGIINLTYPESLKELSYYALGGLVNLQSITLSFTGKYEDSSKIQSADEGAFGAVFSKNGFTNSISLRQYVASSISVSHTFYIPSSLTNITYTGETLNSGAFSGIPNTITVNFTKDIKEIPTSAFNSYKGNGLPDWNKIEKIKLMAFYSAELEEVILGENLTECETDSFGYAPNIKRIVLKSPELNKNISSATPFRYCGQGTSLRRRKP